MPKVLNQVALQICNFLLKKQSDVVSPVISKAQVCPGWLASAYVGLGPLDTEKYPYIVGH